MHTHLLCFNKPEVRPVSHTYTFTPR